MIVLIFLQRFLLAVEPDCNVFTAQCFDNEVDNVKVLSKYQVFELQHYVSKLSGFRLLVNSLFNSFAAML